MVIVIVISGSQAAFEESVRQCLRDEAKEVPPDARPQVRKNVRCIRWNTLRIFLAEHDADGDGSFAAVERSMSDRLLGNPA